MRIQGGRDEGTVFHGQDLRFFLISVWYRAGSFGHLYLTTVEKKKEIHILLYLSYLFDMINGR